MPGAWLNSPKAKARFETEAKKRSLADRIMDLVDAEIAATPYVYSHLIGAEEPLRWAAKPLSWYATQLGVSADTVGDTIGRQAGGAAPFMKHVVKPKGEPRVTLLRPGDPSADKIPEGYANAMKAYYLKATSEKTVSRDEYGQLVGLAEAWGHKAPQVFATICTHWLEYAHVMHTFIDIAKAEAEEQGVELDVYHLTLSRPRIGVMRLVPWVGSEFYNLKLQEAGKADHKGQDLAHSR
ncbi:hypothetical protein [Pinisolibacter sp.]|uniref:hypothetical protein n=1 Tax=Pinisolibacter sp. TaxID=2172024 RepID=UPI002FDDF15B